MSPDPEKDIENKEQIQRRASVMDGTCTDTIHDEVFGDITEGGPNYRAVSFPNSGSRGI